MFIRFHKRLTLQIHNLVEPWWCSYGPGQKTRNKNTEDSGGPFLQKIRVGYQCDLDRHRYCICLKNITRRQCLATRINKSLEDIKVCPPPHFSSCLCDLILFHSCDLRHRTVVLLLLGCLSPPSCWSFSNWTLRPWTPVPYWHALQLTMPGKSQLDHRRCCTLIVHQSFWFVAAKFDSGSTHNDKDGLMLEEKLASTNYSYIDSNSLLDCFRRIEPIRAL